MIPEQTQTPFIITHQDYSYIPALLECLMKKNAADPCGRRQTV